MSDTYTASDGEERPWPPPENWYRAADGRWWHPAHGPAEDDDDRPKTLPVWDFVESTDLVESDNPVPANASNGAPGEEFGLEVRSGTPTGEVPAVRPDATADVDGDTNRRDSPAPTRWKWAAAALFVILGLAVGAQAFFGGTNTDVSTASSQESTGEASEDGGRADTPEDDPSVEDDSATPSTMTGEPPADDDGSETADPPASTATDPEVAAKVADFRRQLSEHDLATDDLTDDQITTFASTYCVYAGGAADLAAFDELRQVAVTTSSSNLTPTQLNVTINTAILVFCPVEADRLGIAEATSP